LICFTNKGIRRIRIIITSPIIERAQEIPLSGEKMGETALWINIITQETAIYKGFSMVLIE
jgi:hypothetical protein